MGSHVAAAASPHRVPLHPSLKDLAFKDGTHMNTLPDSIRRDISDHFQHGGINDFSSTARPPSEGTIYGNHDCILTYRFEDNLDQTLQATRFTITGQIGLRKQQIIVLTIPGTMGGRNFGFVIITSVGSWKRIQFGDDEGSIVTTWSIWQPIHKRQRTTSPQMPVILRLKQAGSPGVDPLVARPLPTRDAAVTAQDRGSAKTARQRTTTSHTSKGTSSARKRHRIEENDIVQPKRIASRPRRHTSNSMRYGESDDSGDDIPFRSRAGLQRTDDVNKDNAKTATKDDTIQVRQESTDNTTFNQPHEKPHEAVDPKPQDTAAPILITSTPIKTSPSQSSPSESASPSENYHKITVIFKDENNIEQDRETLDQCASAQDLFDAACAAEIANSKTRLLEIKVGDKENKVIRKDKQSDFEKKLLRVIDGLLSANVEADDIAVVVKPYM